MAILYHRNNRQFNRGLLHVFVASLCAIVLAGCVDNQAGRLGVGPSDRKSNNVRQSEFAAAGDLQVVKFLPPPEDTGNGTRELVAENDLLEVDVFGVDELDRTSRVDASGRISLPLIGQVQAKGKTLPELESEIERRYGSNYLQNPEVTVFLKESSGQRVTVDGQVRRPGIYPVTSTETLVRVIAKAGGFQEIADESKVYVFRQYRTKKLVANYSMKQIRQGKAQDPRIFGGDVIVSFSSSSKVAAKNLREALGLASGAARFASPL